MGPDEQLVVLNKAIEAKKPIHFCWSKEDSVCEENGLVRAQTSYGGAGRHDIIAHRNEETFLLLVPWNKNWLLYVNSSGRTLVVKDPKFMNTRGLLDFWFLTVKDGREHGMFV